MRRVGRVKRGFEIILVIGTLHLEITGFYGRIEFCDGGSNDILLILRNRS